MSENGEKPQHTPPAARKMQKLKNRLIRAHVELRGRKGTTIALKSYRSLLDDLYLIIDPSTDLEEAYRLSQQPQEENLKAAD